MGHVNKYGHKDAKVIFIPDMVGWRSSGCLKCHKQYYDKIRDSAGVVVTVTNSSTDVAAPGWTYAPETKSGGNQRLIYIDAFAAYDSLAEANGGNYKFAGGTEANEQAYRHFNEWVLYAVTGMGASGAGTSYGAGAETQLTAPTPQAMEE